MATLNFIYRSVKKNEELEIRLTQKLQNGTYKTITAKSGAKVFKNEEYSNNPFNKSDTYRGKTNPFNHYKSLVELDGRSFFELVVKSKNIFPDFSDIDKRNAVADIQAKASELESRLNKLANYLTEEAEKTADDQITKTWLEAKVGYFYNPKKENPKASAPDTLMEYFDYYLKANNTIKYGTAKKFTTIKSKLAKRLNQFDYGRPILIRDIDDDFKEQYEAIFSDYATNTISRDLKEIKTLCRHAETKGVEINKEVLRWKPKVESTTIVYLTEEEIEKIKNLTNLSECLDNARDWLVISCLTGQRVSDFMRFEKSWIRYEKNSKGKEIPLIEFTQIKTGTTLALPLHRDVLQILNKRGGEFPRAISDQKYNDYIKEVAQAAGLTTPTKGSKINPETIRAEAGIYPKWELVSSHIGRRSFATNNFGKIPTTLIMSASGHTTEAKFLIYVGKSKTEQAKQLADYF